jgi:two-component system, NtrC family, response regulator HydG
MASKPDRDDDASTVHRPRVPSPALTAASYAVTVTAGPDRGLRFPFDAGRPSRVLLGQSPACEIRLSDRHVSRRHAALDPTSEGLRLVDLGSTNGTFANGLRVVDVFLTGGEVLRAGETTLRVDALAPAAAVALTPSMRFGRMLGGSAEMRRLYPICERLAATDLPVVIEGETGTGKEVLAEALHEASGRRGGPFVVFDCTTVPANLLETALFGHERGAFTGAGEKRRGVFEEAGGGTLLIDEIGELELSLQPKLLRVLERSEVQRVGSSQWTRVDVRVLAATRRDLDREVQAGRFRDDLFFRLAVGRVELPPLRRRKADIGLLARHFWRSLGGEDRPLPEGALARFEDYDWPGNVRELHNAVARLLALGEVALGAAGLEAPADEEGGGMGGAAPDDIIERILARDLPLPRARQEVVDAFERRYVRRVLDRYDGNVVRAAAASGIARRYFQLLRARQGR